MQRLNRLPDELLGRENCPRCSSARVYSSDEEFICLACSYIVVRETKKKSK